MGGVSLFFVPGDARKGMYEMPTDPESEISVETGTANRFICLAASIQACSSIPLVSGVVKVKSSIPVALFVWGAVKKLNRNVVLSCNR